MLACKIVKTIDSSSLSLSTAIKLVEKFQKSNENGCEIEKENFEIDSNWSGY